MKNSRLRERFQTSKKITVHTDGSCYNATGNKGGVGIVMRYGNHVRKLALGSFSSTTSARMEIVGVLIALHLAKDKSAQIIIHCDNQYVVNTWQKRWIDGWDLNTRKNGDLWKLFLKEVEKFTSPMNVVLRWVRGHNGNEDNEIADGLAKHGGESNVALSELPGAASILFYMTGVIFDEMQSS